MKGKKSLYFFKVLKLSVFRLKDSILCAYFKLQYLFLLMRIRRWSLTNEVPTCAPHQIDLKFIECWDKIFQLMRGFYWAFIDTALAIVLQAPLDSINTLWTDVGLMWTLDQHSTTSTVRVTRPGIKLQKSAEIFLYFMRRFPFSWSTFIYNLRSNQIFCVFSNKPDEWN